MGSEPEERARAFGINVPPDWPGLRFVRSSFFSSVAAPWACTASNTRVRATCGSEGRTARLGRREARAAPRELPSDVDRRGPAAGRDGGHAGGREARVLLVAQAPTLPSRALPP